MQSDSDSSNEDDVPELVPVPVVEAKVESAPVEKKIEAEKE